MPSEVLKNPLFVVCAFTFGTSKKQSITIRIVFMFASPQARQIVQLLACIAGVYPCVVVRHEQNLLPTSYRYLRQTAPPLPLSAVQYPFGISDARPLGRRHNVARASLCCLGFGSGGWQQHRARAP